MNFVLFFRLKPSPLFPRINTLSSHEEDCYFVDKRIFNICLRWRKLHLCNTALYEVAEAPLHQVRHRPNDEDFPLNVGRKPKQVYGDAFSKQWPVGQWTRPMVSKGDQTAFIPKDSSCLTWLLRTVINSEWLSSSACILEYGLVNAFLVLNMHGVKKSIGLLWTADALYWQCTTATNQHYPYRIGAGQCNE